MDKHLLAENPMRSPEGGLCIISTSQPVSIYQIYEGHFEHKSKLGQFYEYEDFGGLMTIEEWEQDGRYDKSLDKGIVSSYFYKNSEEKYELYTLRCHHYFTTDIDSTDESEVFKFMNDAWHWYAAYLRWEDE